MSKGEIWVGRESPYDDDDGEPEEQEEWCVECGESPDDCECSGSGGACGECDQPLTECECVCGYCLRIGQCCICDDELYE